MLTVDEVRRLIVERIEECDGQCNRAFWTHNDGVFRGILWVLTGVDHGTRLTEDLQALFKAAGIPSTMKADGMVEYPLPGEPEWPTC